MTELCAFAAFAEELAEAGRIEALRRIDENWPIENKGIGEAFDPVTRAESGHRACASRPYRGTMARSRIEGEELDAKETSSNYRWSLDPIDGTRSFICGPSWTVLIALLDEGRPVLGVIDGPG